MCYLREPMRHSGTLQQKREMRNNLAELRGNRKEKIWLMFFKRHMKSWIGKAQHEQREVWED